MVHMRCDWEGRMPRTRIDDTHEMSLRWVASSNVDYVAWPVTGEPLLIVKYKNGGVYGYLGVSRQKSVAVANAPSVGRYINQKIKGKYKPVKIRDL